MRGFKELRPKLRAGLPLAAEHKVTKGSRDALVRGEMPQEAAGGELGVTMQTATGHSGLRTCYYR